MQEMTSWHSLARMHTHVRAAKILNIEIQIVLFPRHTGLTKGAVQVQLSTLIN